MSKQKQKHSNFDREDLRVHNFTKSKLRKLTDKKGVTFADVITLTVEIYQFRKRLSFPSIRSDDQCFPLPQKTRPQGQSHGPNDPVYPLPYVSIESLARSGHKREKSKRRKAVSLHVNMIIDIFNTYYNPERTLPPHQSLTCSATQERLITNIEKRVRAFHDEAFSMYPTVDMVGLAAETLRCEAYSDPVTDPCVPIEVKNLGLPEVSPAEFHDQLSPEMKDVIDNPHLYRPDTLPELPKATHGSYINEREHARLLDLLHEKSMIEWTVEEPITVGGEFVLSDFFSVKKLTPGSTETRLIQNLSPSNELLDMRRVRFDPRIPTADDLKFILLPADFRGLFVFKKDVSNCFHTLSMRGRELQKHYYAVVPPSVANMCKSRPRSSGPMYLRTLTVPQGHCASVHIAQDVMCHRCDIRPRGVALRDSPQFLSNRPARLPILGVCIDDYVSVADDETKDEADEWYVKVTNKWKGLDVPEKESKNERGVPSEETAILGWSIRSSGQCKGDLIPSLSKMVGAWVAWARMFATPTAKRSQRARLLGKQIHFALAERSVLSVFESFRPYLQSYDRNGTAIDTAMHWTRGEATESINALALLPLTAFDLKRQFCGRIHLSDACRFSPRLADHNIIGMGAGYIEVKNDTAEEIMRFYTTRKNHFHGQISSHDVTNDTQDAKHQQLPDFGDFLQPNKYKYFTGEAFGPPDPPP